MGFADVPGGAGGGRRKLKNNSGKANSLVAIFAFHLTAVCQLGTIPPRTQANLNTSPPETGNKEETQ